MISVCYPLCDCEAIHGLPSTEPAKAASAALRLDTILIENLATDALPEVALEYAVDLLTWIIENLTAAQLKDSDSLKAFQQLLMVTLQYDEDHYHEYVAILVHYLQDTEFHASIATPDVLDSLVGLMLDFEARITAEETEEVFKELSVAGTDAAAISGNTNVLLLAQLINSISALSAIDTFSRDFDMRSPVIETIRARLRAPVESPCAVCACVMLGNLAMSDAICIDMVSIMDLHTTLIDILSSSRHPALLYAAAGFMRHLTFPEVNRPILADAGLLQTCSRLLELGDPSVRGEAAAMLCKLVTNSFYNIEKVVYGKVEREIQHADSADDSSPAGVTILQHIVEQALSPGGPLPSTAMKNPMIELGRTIVAILRYLGRPNAEKDVDAVRKEMFKISTVARPVVRLVQQRFYADARSEGLLGLGLFAQSLEGASRVIEEVEADSGLLEALKDYAGPTSQDTEQQQPAAGRDVQNAMVFLQVLQNNAVGQLQS